MKIRELIKQDIDLDMYDDYDERCACALCCPLELTEMGERQFKDVLDMDVTINNDDIDVLSGLVHTETDKEADALRDFVVSAAGYCSDSEYQAWFKEGEGNDYIF